MPYSSIEPLLGECETYSWLETDRESPPMLTEAFQQQYSSSDLVDIAIHSCELGNDMFPPTTRSKRGFASSGQDDRGMRR